MSAAVLCTNPECKNQAQRFFAPFSSIVRQSLTISIPSVTVTQASGQTDPTNSSPVRFAVTFGETVTGFDSSDVVFSSSTAPGTLAATVSGNGSAYTVEITGMTDAGDVIVSVGAGAAQDTAGNISTASSGGDGTVRYDPSYVPNVACTGITLSGLTVAENQPAGTVVGTLSATDADGGPHTFYRVVRRDGWLDNGSFVINGNVLKTAASFDFETKNALTVYIRANDSYGASCFNSFTINVGNMNESPTGLALSYRWVDEEKPAGTEVGFFTTSGDPDAGDTHSYGLVSGDGGEDSGLFFVEGNTLRTAKSFDYETEEKHSYNIRIRTSDKGGLSFEKSFTVRVNDMNEPPTDIDLSVTEVNENNRIATQIGIFSASDPNPCDSHTFSLVSGDGDTDNGVFRISGSILYPRVSFDYENQAEKNSYSIRVLANDGHGGTHEKSFVITVKNVNDPPTISNIRDMRLRGVGTDDDLTGTADFKVSDQDTPFGNLTISAESSDPELLPVENITFGGSGSERFVTLTPAKGKSGSMAVTVTVSDGEITAETEFTLSVTLEPAPAFDGITVESVADPDTPVSPGDTLTYTAVLPNTGDADAEDVVFTLPAPANTAHVSGSVSVKITDTETGEVLTDSDDSPQPVYNSESGQLEWSGDIPAGARAEIVFDITVDDDVETGDVITARSWSLSYDFDGDGKNDITAEPEDDPDASENPPLRIVIPEPECVEGDVNNDGEYDLKDAVMVLQILVGIETDAADSLCADVNRDGRIGLAELFFILNHLAG
ncbi:cadherin domain-containing protein [Desulfonema magnum]|uniref:cadherin domain-containing protein n=1 Tax=Desulfonema magnum TaxID=45655 RepID=UPI001A9B3AA0|nr:cadherin domain-containing protein [Desulfonema magnum]